MNMRRKVWGIAFAIVGVLLGGCGDATQPSPTASAPAGSDAFLPSPPPTCVVSPPASAPDFGTGSGAIRLSWPPIGTWAGPGISPVALGIAAGPSQVRLTGRLLDGDANAEFTGFGGEQSPVSDLVLAGPFKDTEELLGYVTLPEPGCWQFEIDADGEKQSLTIYAYGETPPPGCTVSQAMEVRTDIAPGLGAGPVWMIASPAWEWGEPGDLAKTIWIIDDSVVGPVRITGRRLDGDERARFQGFDGGVSTDGREILLKAPHSRSTDQRGYVIYPSAGCWRFTAESDGRAIAEITRYLYDVLP